ncbi:MAG: gas vesicle protein [Firmicutes bacterium]|nr:gas vesicle protein [Bacillota bacterium]MCL5040128.1 gas vesicle protein [Bacillota bacterium]
MKPTGTAQATLTDLLDRAFDKGLVLTADVIISVSGIPLLGLNIRAILAGMETLLEYGIMADWDKAQRKAFRKTPQRNPLIFSEKGPWPITGGSNLCSTNLCPD